jgi:hypothetical protein
VAQAELLGAGYSTIKEAQPSLVVVGGEGGWAAVLGPVSDGVLAAIDVVIRIAEVTCSQDNMHKPGGQEGMQVVTSLRLQGPLPGTCTACLSDLSTMPVQVGTISPWYSPRVGHEAVEKKSKEMSMPEPMSGRLVTRRVVYLQ